MVIMSEFSNPYRKIIIDNGIVKPEVLGNYGGECDQGIAAKVDENTILGLYTENNRLYLVKNNDVLDITNSEISCFNEKVYDERIFELKVDGTVYYSEEYTAMCTMEEILYGEIEEWHDFLLHLAKILRSEQSRKNFIVGRTRRK